MNMQLSDLCIKNGGSHFLIEVASREFVDNLVSLLKAPLGINPDVRQRLLELIQMWALAFESRPELNYMMSAYQGLRNEGLQFPPEERVAAAFVDTAAPPDWADSDVCMRCRSAFTFRNRKHHCRNCGNVFCGQCSTQTMVLPHLGINEPVRVCDGCHSNKAQAPSTGKPQPRRAATVPSYQQSHSNQSNRVASDSEDLDLKRALELSLAESKKNEVIDTPKREAPREQRGQTAADEDDAELKAAIEASLRESAPAAVPTKDTYNYPTLSSSTSTTVPYSNTQVPLESAKPQPQPQPQPIVAVNPNELQPTEQENIKLFATLIDRLKHDPDGSILRDPQIQELYEGISALRPKLARSLGECVGKYESLVDTHSKLATVVKYYDRILEARLASTYNRGQYGNFEPRGQPSDPYSGGLPNTYYGSTQPRQFTALPNSTENRSTGASYYDSQYTHDSEPRTDYNASYNRNHAPHTGVYASEAYSEPVQAQEPKEEVSLIDL